VERRRSVLSLPATDLHQSASNDLLPKYQDLLPCHPVIETDQTENQFDETQHPSQRRRFCAPRQPDLIFDSNSRAEPLRADPEIS
jgi:hypothetical protein